MKTTTAYIALSLRVINGSPTVLGPAIGVTEDDALSHSGHAPVTTYGPFRIHGLSGRVAELEAENRRLRSDLDEERRRGNQDRAALDREIERLKSELANCTQCGELDDALRQAKDDYELALQENDRIRARFGNVRLVEETLRNSTENRSPNDFVPWTAEALLALAGKLAEALAGVGR